MTPTLQHRASNGTQRGQSGGGYNGELTHVRQIKSGLEVTGEPKKNFAESGKPSGNNNSNIDSDGFVYGDSA